MADKPKGLTGIDVVSGAAQDSPTAFRGFLTITATADDGSTFVGQLDPATVRMMALHWTEAAEAAEQDAIVVTLLARDFELSPEVTGAFLVEMRKERERRHRQDPQLGRDHG